MIQTLRSSVYATITVRQTLNSITHGTKILRPLLLSLKPHLVIVAGAPVSRIRAARPARLAVAVGPPALAVGPPAVAAAAAVAVVAVRARLFGAAPVAVTRAVAVAVALRVAVAALAVASLAAVAAVAAFGAVEGLSLIHI